MSLAITHDRERIDLLNEPTLARLQVRGRNLLEKRDERKKQLQEYRHIAWLQPLWVKLMVVFFVLALLVGGAVFAQLAINPFGFGAATWFVAVGVAGMVAFTMHQMLEYLPYKPVKVILTITAFAASMYALILLGIIRAEVFFLYFKNIISSNDAGMGIENANEFYTSTVYLLKTFMGSAAVAMELAGGLGLHALVEASTIEKSIRDNAHRVAQTQFDFEGTNAELEDIAEKMTLSKNAGKVYEAQARRDLCLAVLRRFNKSGIVRKIGGGILAILLSSPGLHAADMIITLLDLSASAASTDHSGTTTNFSKNLEAVNTLILQLPGGTRFLVLGITAESFGRPAVLVDRVLPSSPGALLFLDQIAIGRQQIKRDFQKASASIYPRSLHTDILGALTFAADYLSGVSGSKTIYLLSDLRQSTRELDLEHATEIDVESALTRAEKLHLLPRLQGVNIYALGVSGSGKTIAYAYALEQFWRGYFKRAGANLRRYSATRDIQPMLAVKSGEQGDE